MWVGGCGDGVGRGRLKNVDVRRCMMRLCVMDRDERGMNVMIPPPLVLSERILGCFSEAKNEVASNCNQTS